MFDCIPFAVVDQRTSCAEALTGEWMHTATPMYPVVPRVELDVRTFCRQKPLEEPLTRPWYAPLLGLVVTICTVALFVVNSTPSTMLFSSNPDVNSLAIRYATATHRHLLVTAFHTNPTSRRVDMTVVVGRATVLASNDAPHVIARAVPLSVIAIQSVCPIVGVPERFVVKDVIAAASAVME
jgi:hypothetical protein